MCILTLVIPRAELSCNFERRLNLIPFVDPKGFNIISFLYLVAEDLVCMAKLVLKSCCILQMDAQFWSSGYFFPLGDKNHTTEVADKCPIYMLFEKIL